jgi:hypothetical protein
MAGTLTIPQTTLPVGTRSFGPTTISDTDTGVILTVDRTLAGGLTATPATHISLIIEQSNDGGANWEQLAIAGIEGGVVPAKNGQTATTSSVGTDWDKGTGRQVRATIVVTGAAVAVAGSLVTS